MGRTRLTGSTGERLLRLLHTVASAGRPLSLPEITDAVGLPRPTVYRLVALLEDTGHVIREADARRYSPGPELQRMALDVLQSQPRRAARYAVLRRLAARVGEACNIVLLDGGQLTYIERVDTQWPLRIRLEVGSHVPLHCTATGKLLLALQSKRVRDRLLRAAPLEALTPRSITDPERLEAALSHIRHTRVGTDDQEFLPEMVAVAVPVMPPSGPPVVAVSIHAPVFRRSLEALREFLPDLQATATELEAVLYEDLATESGT